FAPWPAFDFAVALIARPWVRGAAPRTARDRTTSCETRYNVKRKMTASAPVVQMPCVALAETATTSVVRQPTHRLNEQPDRHYKKLRWCSTHPLTIASVSRREPYRILNSSLGMEREESARWRRAHDDPETPKPTAATACDIRQTPQSRKRTPAA